MKYIAVLFCVLGLTIAGCGGDKKSDDKSGTKTKTETSKSKSKSKS